ncbi:MAG: hypothetical protein QNJ41_04835 [Xenococcaceae cyanobacterium MO_188.B32]|nr:hypothetical protein [Xenococcaceae cyanobacterium MO_188.B32]
MLLSVLWLHQLGHKLEIAPGLMTIIYGAIRLRDRGKQSDRSIEKITGKVRGLKE